MNIFKRTASIIIGVCVCISAVPYTAFASENDTLKLGDRDKYVLELQQALYEQNYLMTKPTGYFGEQTQDAIRQFQTDNDMNIDGRAGVGTRKALLGPDYTEIPPGRVADPKIDSNYDEVTRTDVLMLGDKDKYVKKLQEALIDKGLLSTQATGYFGSATQSAVAEFQEKCELDSDGKAGPRTLKKLWGSYERLPETRKVSSGLADKYCLGDTGDVVEKIQKRLKELDYYNLDYVTEYFGPKTLEAVEEFQDRNGLTADGVVGQRTYAALMSEKANPYKSGKSGGGKSSSAKKDSDDDASSGKSDGDGSDSSDVKKMIEYAKDFLGTPYVYGANGPNSFDCSGFTSYVLKHMGVKSPRTAADQSRHSAWESISRDNLKAGDLVFFKTTSAKIGHVGIYLGGGKFIHASSGKKMKVTISNLSGYYSERFRGARRVF